MGGAYSLLSLSTAGSMHKSKACCAPWLHSMASTVVFLH